VLVSLGLLSLMVGLLAGVIRNYASLMSYSGSADLSDRAQQWLAQVARECDQAVEVYSPSASEPTSDRLRMVRLRNDQSTRYDGWQPPDYQPWQPVRSSDIATWTYFRQGEDWLQTRQLSDGSLEQRKLLSGINDFSAQHLDPTSLVLRLSLLQGRRLRVLETRVYRWVR